MKKGSDTIIFNPVKILHEKTLILRYHRIRYLGFDLTCSSLMTGTNEITANKKKITHKTILIIPSNLS
jgi:hypothetical protein